MLGTEAFCRELYINGLGGTVAVLSHLWPRLCLVTKMTLSSTTVMTSQYPESRTRAVWPTAACSTAWRLHDGCRAAAGRSLARKLETLSRIVTAAVCWAAQDQPTHLSCSGGRILASFTIIHWLTWQWRQMCKEKY